VSRLGSYGDVTVRWFSTRQVDTDDDSEPVPLGSVLPPSGSVTLTNGQETAMFTVKVIRLVLCKYSSQEIELFYAVSASFDLKFKSCRIEL